MAYSKAQTREVAEMENEWEIASGLLVLDWKEGQSLVFWERRGIVAAYLTAFNAASV